MCCVLHYIQFFFLKTLFNATPRFKVTQVDCTLASFKSAICVLDCNIYFFNFYLQCGKQMNVDIEPISSCAGSEHGSHLLKKYGDDTHLLKPTFIPTILLNGSRDNQAAILKNFLLEVCKLINIPLPPPCL